MRPRGERALGCCGLCTCPAAAGGKGGLGQEVKGALSSGLVFFGWFGTASRQQRFPTPEDRSPREKGGRARADLCACVAGLSDAPLMQTSLPGAQVVHTHDSRCGVVTRPAGSVLPLPPSAPRSPINAKRAPLPVARRPILGSQGKRHNPLPAPAAPPPHAQPHPTAPLVQRRTIFWGSVLLSRRMRFWLRNEEMALEEMVQRLNAVSKNTGRRSRWP